MRAYIDTNIFVYSMFAHPVFGETCREIVDDLEAGVIQGVASTLVPLEVMSVAVEHDPSKAGIAVNSLYSLPLTIVEVSQDILLSASEIVSKYNLAGYDATHVATSLKSDTQTIISNDDEFKRVKEVTLLKPLDYRKSGKKR